MSAHDPEDTSEVEYLSDREADRPGAASGRRRALAGVGAFALLLVAGAGAYGVVQFMSSGDSAATAVPADALGYVSLDLDPSGGQKIAAYETMRKFPALEEQLDLDSDDDPREWLFDALNSEAPPSCSMDFEDDVAPWLGDKLAFAAVEGDEEPEPFFVLQVRDVDAAQETIGEMFSCGQDEEDYGTATVGDFMIVAPSADLAEDLAADAGDSSLADDDTFRARTSDAGDPGVITGYLAPAAVDLMLDRAESMGSGIGDIGGMGGMEGPEPGMEWGMESGMESGSVPPTALPSLPASPGVAPEGGLPTDPQMDGMGSAGGMEGIEGIEGMEGMEGMVPPVDDAQLDLMRDYVEGFEGAAMQVRFADGGLEMEMVATGIQQGEDLEGGDSGMGDLPGSTALAFGFAAGPDAVDTIAESMKAQMSDAEYESGIEEFESETGLTFPEDVQTLLGDGMSLAVDSSIDIEALGRAFLGGQTEGLDLPVGLRIVSDDTQAVVEVAEKLQALVPPEAPVSMEVEEGDGAVAVGVDADYVADLAGDGDLGESDAFQDAVPDAGDRLGALYLDFDADNWLEELAQDDPEAVENIKPLSSLGMSGSVDGDTVRMLMRLTTD